jgi:predicted acyl esterase
MSDYAAIQSEKDRNAKIAHDKWIASLTPKKRHEVKKTLGTLEFKTDYNVGGPKTNQDADDNDNNENFGGVESLDEIANEINETIRQLNAEKQPIAQAASILRLYAADLADSMQADCFKFATGIIDVQMTQTKIAIKWGVQRATVCKEVKRIQKRYRLKPRPEQRDETTAKSYAKRAINIHLNNQRAFR